MGTSPARHLLRGGCRRCHPLPATRGSGSRTKPETATKELRAPATHAAVHQATATVGATAIRGIDRAADATTARGGSPPGTGGGAVGGAVRGRGRAVATTDGGMNVARGARDGTDEGGAQDMGGGGTQGESSGSPDDRPAGCVGPADTEHGPANTGDDSNDGRGGIAGEGKGVARATGHPKTSVAAANFDARSDAPAATVHAAGIGPVGRRLAQDRQERVAGGNRGGTRGRDGTAEERQALRPGQRRRTKVPGEARSRGHPGVRAIK